MLRPRWIGVLALCLLVAGVFAFLGQWQLGRAIQTDPPPAGVTEEFRALDDVVVPGEYLPEPYVGQRTEAAGTWIGGDFLVVSSRYNDDIEGYWVTGQLRLDGDVSIAVALGWAQERADADAAALALEQTAAGTGATISGRLISDEGVQIPPVDDPQRMDRMSPAALLNHWHDTESLSVYRPYLASVEAPDGLVDISSPAPDELSPVNWLNVFYAAEWAIFACFAFYIWYRLAKDAWEREVEDLEDAAGPAS
ncbi:SURF1 family protein [Microbacterium sp. NPDC056234]|uniref:SURF1 family protein n=1 Tax=Microbacterium sp. NPDC056234 TaxID=3345757 RepID=UPI0035D6EB8C